LKNYIEVYPCGTKTQITDIKTDGHITGINLRGIHANIMYEVSYFFNNQYQSHWFYEIQLNFQENIEKEKIGFKEILKNKI
jgi:Neuraminidase (sialidase)